MSRYLTRVACYIGGGFAGGCAVGLVAFLVAVKAMEAEEAREVAT